MTAEQMKQVYLTKTNLASEISLPTPTEIPAMSKSIQLKTITYVSGPTTTRVDIKDLSLEAAVAMIQDAENAIEQLKGLKNKPKAVTKQIEELQEGINALVKELDNREETK